MRQTTECENRQKFVYLQDTVKAVIISTAMFSLSSCDVNSSDDFLEEIITETEEIIDESLTHGSNPVMGTQCIKCQCPTGDC